MDMTNMAGEELNMKLKDDTSTAPEDNDVDTTLNNVDAQLDTNDSIKQSNLTQDDEPTEQNANEYFTTSDGRKLFSRTWKNEEETSPKALVFISHGYSEHSAYYKTIADILVKEGCYVFAHDHIGHGNSDGDRVHVDHYNTFVTDILEHVNDVKCQFPPEMKMFVIGHSMGAKMAVLAAMQRPQLFSGVVLLGPALGNSKALGTFSKFYIRIAALFAPQFLIFKVTEANREEYRPTRNEETMKEFNEDPLVFHEGMKAKVLLRLVQASEEIQTKTATVEWPFIILHGTEDHLCPLESSQVFYDKAKSVDKTLNVYEGCYHSVHHEPEPDGSKVRDDIREWIVQRM